MRAVLFGFLRHQAHVRYAAHGGRIERAVLLAVFDHRLVNGGVAAVRDNSLRILQLVIRVPHLAGITNHRRHRGIDDHVAGHMQVGDAFMGVHHRHGRASLIKGLYIAFDRLLLVAGQLLNSAVKVADTAVRVEASTLQHVSVLLQHLFIELFYHDTEHDWVGDLHHGGFQVQREQHAALFGIADLAVNKAAQTAATHAGGVNDFACLYRKALF